jgi:centromeric protein E
VDQIDLLQEQVKMLAGEVALCTSSLKRLSEQAANNPDDSQIQEQIEKLKNEIDEKKSHIRVLEQRMAQSLETTEDPAIRTEMSQTFSKLSTQLSEKTFELEIMSADNRILQDQLQAKVSRGWDLLSNRCSTDQFDFTFCTQIGIRKCRTRRNSCSTEARN